ncbi:hypothetical protein JQC67_05765 [Aurantibacter crassamenti]|uniref:hypothetical protein n=1 Tax=Aurantibacter crassamenti TaxID=1837375 RepID=UPI00193AC80D|nr:hypothetical protein [Aurantibacter crassamenti]MBM1105644.1 hypothetical protein [Aurantibacter crassamenti]
MTEPNSLEKKDTYMKIPDYKKRAALAAENWKRLQAQKNQKSTDFKDSPKTSTEMEDQSIERTMADLIDKLAIPKTKVKGISIVKEQKTNQELRDSA